MYVYVEIEIMVGKILSISSITNSLILMNASHVYKYIYNSFEKYFTTIRFYSSNKKAKFTFRVFLHFSSVFHLNIPHLFHGASRGGPAPPTIRPKCDLTPGQRTKLYYLCEARLEGYEMIYI